MKVATTERGWRGALRTLTVKELIEALEDEDAEMPVVFVTDYNDIGHTQQVHAIEGNLDEEPIHETAYSASGWAVLNHERERPEDVDDEDETAPRVLVLR